MGSFSIWHLLILVVPIIVVIGVVLAIRKRPPAPGAMRFRSLTPISVCLLILLTFGIVAGVAALFVDIGEYRLIVSLRDGAFEDRARAMAMVEAVEARKEYVSLALLITFLPTALAAMVWIYRANANLWAGGVSGLKFSPAQAIAWYFVPIANLWKPLLAMREIWHGSGNSRPDFPGAESKQIPGLMKGWWFLWLAYAIVGQLADQISSRAETIELWRAANIASIAASILGIAASGAFFLIVMAIAGRQANDGVARVSPSMLDARPVSDGQL